MKPYFVQAEPSHPAFPDLAKGFLVRPSSHLYPILQWEDLTKKEQQNYKWANGSMHRFIRHQGHAQPLEGFNHISADDPLALSPGKWQGACSDTYFSGMLLSFYSEEYVRLARYTQVSLGFAREQGYRVLSS